MKPTADRAGIRVNLTLPLDTVAVLDRIGAVTGAGRATVLREFILEAQVQFGHIAHALELAQSKNMDAFRVLTESINSSVSDAQQMSLDIKRTRRRAMRQKAKA